MKEDAYHQPVLLTEAVDSLHLKKRGKYIDATLGSGGHSLEILKNGGSVLGLEMDPLMLKLAEERLKQACPALKISFKSAVKLVQTNFKEIDQVAQANGFGQVDGILFDLGVSNLHFQSLERGFSFQNPEAALDMRLSPVQGVAAADLLNQLREDQLIELFSQTLTFSQVKRLVGKIVARRKEKPFQTVGDLLTVTEFLGKEQRGKLHPATKVFLTLRMAVNSELANLKSALPKAVSLLKPRGRLLVISFHSLEDALVKEFFRQEEKEGKGKILTKKPIAPAETEIKQNPKARSAKLRLLEKI